MSERPDALVLRALGLGDVLAGVPALRALRRGLPDHQIVLAGPPATAGLLVDAAIVDDVLPARELEPLEMPPGVRVDVAVDLHGNGPASRRLLEVLEPRRLLSFGRPADGVAGPPWDPDEHERRRWCRLVSAELGVDADPDDLLLPRPVDTSVRPGCVVVHPGAAYPSRRWPPERWAQVAHALAADHHVVVTGGPDEVDLTREVVERAGLPPTAMLAGATSVTALAALVARARLVLCGDTGVAHLASAYRTPSVLLFGPTPPALWGPPTDGPHSVLWHGQGRGNPHATAPDPALLRIEAEEVFAAALAVLGRTAAAG